VSEREQFLNLFWEMQPKFSRFYARALNEMDLSISQYALLNQLAVSGGPMTEISCKLHVSKPAVTNLVDRLEKKKMIKRVAHPKDRRVYLLEIQPKGEKIVREIQSEILKFLLKTFDQLNAAERKSLVRFYALISKTIDEVLFEPCGTKT